MSSPLKDYKTLVTEKGILIVIIAVIAVLWSVNQLTFISFFVIAGSAAALLLQLEVNNRIEELKIRRSVAQERRITNEQGVQSLRANALNGLPSPIVLVDDNHTITFANDAALTLLGHEIVTNDVFLYLRQSSFVTALDKVLAGDPAHNGTIRYTNSHGRSFDLTLGPVTNTEANAAEPIQALVFFYEVTSLLRTEQMRVDFVANASHELRTPLTSITGFIETLQGPARDDIEAQQRFLDIMSSEADRMIRLIDDLLSLSQIEMTRHITPESTIDVQTVINSTITTFSTRASKRGIKFISNMEDNLPRVVADSDQITQVFVNLIGNAAKYADQDTNIHVSATLAHTGKSVILSVRDEGPGIAMEHLGRLTERFYRVDTARSRKMGGTGLGLAIVKHILLRHGSQLDIKSKIGQGTVFSFKLPVSRNTAPSDVTKVK
ncbi:sensor histidine kinase [Kordiimonas pumila]|uniref:histidine kinase n=1 Tax=Kordiimonas pumila TaxID=2161677 RepID=A0ABV7D209_9PROT|nr:ATP-binding protein [Kordiimonas pumila]